MTCILAQNEFLPARGMSDRQSLLPVDLTGGVESASNSPGQKGLRMRNLLVLLFGLSSGVLLWMLYSPFAGILAIGATAIVFAFLGARNSQQVLQSPEKMRALQTKKRDLERTLGYFPLYIDIEDGVDAKGTIKEITDTLKRFEDIPELELLLEVVSEGGEQFDLSVRKCVPLILLPQFQPGREFLLRIDPNRENEISFVSCVTTDGHTIDLSRHNVG